MHRHTIHTTPIMAIYATAKHAQHCGAPQHKTALFVFMQVLCNSLIQYNEYQRTMQPLQLHQTLSNAIKCNKMHSYTVAIHYNSKQHTLMDLNAI